MTERLYAILAGIDMLELVVFLSAIVGVVKVARGVWPWVARTKDFLDDWSGTPERNGHPARPGILERLTDLEDSVAHIKYELSYNSGKSVKDIVKQNRDEIREMRQANAGSTETR